MVDGRGHRAPPPAGPEEHDRLPPVGHLPGDHVTAAHAAGSQATGHGVDGGLEVGPAQRAGPVDDGGGRRWMGAGQQPVEGGDVPGAPRPSVAGGVGLPIGGPQPHEAGTGPSTASTVSIRTGGASRQLGMPSSGSATGYLFSWIPAQWAWLSSCRVKHACSEL